MTPERIAELRQIVFYDKDRDEMLNEIERLRAALVDAIEGMEDMRPYVDPYFAEKWEHDGYIERAKAMVKR